jgi:Lon protease-like protein
MTRRRIPLFPLPGVVLLPGALLPLHIFEPRYRAMVADALVGERTIGMAMIQPGCELADPTPEILPVGGAGRIVESEELPDGRYNIVLQGEFRYRVVEESPRAPYRIAEVQELVSVPFPDAEEASRAIGRLRSLFAGIAAAMEMPPLPAGELDPERLASEVALRLRYDPSELQEVLETDSIPSRFAALFTRIREWQARIEFLAPFRTGEGDPSTN